MTLDELDKDLELCREHLKITNNEGTKIESFLTRFLLIHICAKYEIEVKNSITHKVKQTGDEEMISFTKGSIERIRNIKPDDLRGNVLKKFSQDYLERFDNTVGKEALVRYGNIVINRDKCAHGNDPIHMTLDELITSHKKAKEVLIVVHNIINSHP